MKKIKAIEGDLSEKRIGLTEANIELIKHKVSKLLELVRHSEKYGCTSSHFHHF